MGRISLGSAFVLLDAVASGWTMASYNTTSAVCWALVGLSAGSIVSVWAWADSIFSGGTEPADPVDEPART